VKEGQEGQPEEAYKMWGWRSWTAVKVVRGGRACLGSYRPTQPRFPFHTFVS
jgi:hypothetical protein